MSTLKDKTITSTYDQLIKRTDTYSATGSRLELMDDSGVSVNSSVYLDITNQRVGLGVATPGVALDVLVGDSGYIQTRAADNGVAAKLGANDDGSGALILNDEGAAQRILLSGKDDVDSYINNGGNFGIGVTAPQGDLHVKDTSGQAKIIIDCAAGNDSILDFQEDGNSKSYLMMDGTDDELEFWVGGSERMHMKSDGNIGIGTDDPSALLSLEGSANPRLLIVSTTGSTNSQLYAGNGFDGLELIQLTLSI